MRVEIYTEKERNVEDKRGAVVYDVANQTVFVEFPDEELQKKVDTYLHTQRTYQIPVSQEIDDVRIDVRYPYESKMYMELALNTLWARTGVFVDWSTQEE